MCMLEVGMPGSQRFMHHLFGNFSYYVLSGFEFISILEFHCSYAKSFISFWHLARYMNEDFKLQEMLSAGVQRERKS